MPWLAVDGIVLSPPDGDLRDEEFVRSIGHLHHLFRSDFVTLLVAEDAYYKLSDTGTPPWTLRDSRRDVGRLLLAILDRATSLESWAGVDDVLLGERGADPDHHLVARPNEWVDHYHNSCCLLLLGHEKRGLDTPPPIVTSDTSGALEVEVSGVISILESRITITTPHEYRENVQHLDDITATHEVYEPSELWMERELRAAVNLHIRQRSPNYLDRWFVDSLDYDSKSEFLESLEPRGFLNIQSRVRALLRAIGNCVTADAQDRTHPLRTDQGGNAPQVKRPTDGASAWRREIDDEYRLHYWRTGEGVELAVVVNHNEFHIPE